MKRIRRIISFILCAALLISCMVTSASAASDEIHSYKYMDFTNCGWIGAGSSKTFSVQGLADNTSNIIYLLCSRDSGAQLSGYASSGGFIIEITELWQSGSICCYRVKSNSASAFNKEFSLTVTNNHASLGQVFNIYKVFTVGASGIVKLDASGITGAWGFSSDLVNNTFVQREKFSVSSLPYTYYVNGWHSGDGDHFVDVMIPISKLVGFEQCSLDVYGYSDYSYHLMSVTVLYNGFYLPFDMTNVVINPPGDDLDDPSDYISVLFDVPEQISANSVITIRFLFDDGLCPEDDRWGFTFQSLCGRYSFVKSEYELLFDIYDILSDLDLVLEDLALEVWSLKELLHEDLEQTNTWLSKLYTSSVSISNYIANFRTMVSTGFNNVGQWFSDLVSSITTGINDIGRWISDLGTSVTGSIAEWGQGIIDAIVSTNSDAADEFGDKSDQQSGEISDSIDKIDQMDKPDISDIINPTVPSDPSDSTSPGVDPTEDPASKPVEVMDPETVSLFSGVLGVFFENGIFSSIFSFSLLMMLASYVLFGKK